MTEERKCKKGRLSSILFNSFTTICLWFGDYPQGSLYHEPVTPGKAPGSDSIFPELILHAGVALKSCLCGFLSLFLHQLKIPKIWRRALVVAIPKPKKPVENPKSYRPMFLLCVPCKILERLIHTRVKSIIDPQVPYGHAGFRHGRLTVDQTVLLTQNIEDSFEAKKTGAVFVD